LVYILLIIDGQTHVVGSSDQPLAAKHPLGGTKKATCVLGRDYPLNINDHNYSQPIGKTFKHDS
jgi:hypothetical protein